MKCRHCKSEVSLPLIDLGSAPPSNAYLSKVALYKPEKWFPLRVLICEKCWLVQAESYSQADELFNEEYAYFSSFSDIWLHHAQAYVSTMVERFNLDDKSLVVEVAANDGYLLQYVRDRGIPCFGIEPTKSTASAARQKGIEIIEDFFGVGLVDGLVEQKGQADLIAANNVLAHVPDINDFTSGFTAMLKPTGVATFEFPHLMRLIDENQFDTIYHEHFSYLSFTTVRRIFKNNGLSVFDVEELETHGGSLRVYAQRADTAHHQESSRVAALLETEASAGIDCAEYYAGLQERADRIKDDLLSFLIEQKKMGKCIMAYGAAAKGNTLLNYAGIRPDLINCVVDRNPAKQGRYMPGSRIPIVKEERLIKREPDYVLILPWNIRSEVKTQLAYIKDWGGKFVTAVPQLEIT